MRTSYRSLSKIARLGCAAALLSFTACVAPQPLNEFTLARTAVQSAKEAGAENFAAGLWYQAQNQFRMGQKALKDKDNESAKKHFTSAVSLAEKAENAARLKRFETGETF